MAFVAAQIGDRIATCEKCYARWLPAASGGLYVAPEALGEGEVPADVIAKRVPTPIARRTAEVTSITGLSCHRFRGAK